MVKKIIKQIIPSSWLKPLRPAYHGLAALGASFHFGRPSEKMIVVGITGSVGKSTTAAMLAYILNQAGKKCGYITTVNFYNGAVDVLNKHGLSMPGGWLMQKQLKECYKNGCKYVIIECTSEGLAQNRHWGINFDMALLTNLSKAHLEAHGGFENYKNAKKKLFFATAGSAVKNNFGKKIFGSNLDGGFAEEFLQLSGAEKFAVSLRGNKPSVSLKMFNINPGDIKLTMAGGFNADNAALAAAAGDILGVGLVEGLKYLAGFKGVPGRMEEIENSRGIKIFVDYGCEPASFTAAIKAAAALAPQKLIHVFGSTGGHRDSEKRFLFGQASAQYANEIIITNDDVYDSDPEKIAKDIELGIKNQESRKGLQVRTILDRREAIRYAISTAKAGDLVLITGKGSEQFLVLPGNKRIVWDDREVVKQELGQNSSSSL
ncbi:MAG: UDP-N-acetylmuramyl-tripeptide synthetase [Candidatus Doudnabacteria bacterium]|nr:UDP-N-acetylmuramyl-tripeptide synthetase [Candidatus Doudnabacteria bacterium]